MIVFNLRPKENLDKLPGNLSPGHKWDRFRLEMAWSKIFWTWTIHSPQHPSIKCPWTVFFFNPAWLWPAK